jgi:CHAD domain-containing protein
MDLFSTSEDVMSFVDDYVAQIISLEVSLYHSRAQLLAGSDSTALHELRIAVRKIRSLLRPLRKLPEVGALSQAAAQVGRETTPTRDLEVMIGELQDSGYAPSAETRRRQLAPAYRQVAESRAVHGLLLALDRWPEAFRAAERAGHLDGIKRRIRKAIGKRLGQLIDGLHDPHFDRYELRIIVKNARYLTEAFPTLSPLTAKSRAQLKSVQASLGAWHDHHQWCLRAASETDLAPLAPHWTQAAQQALHAAEQKLQTLLTHLERDLGRQASRRSPA